MGRGEAVLWAWGLIYLDDDESGDKRDVAGHQRSEVDASAQDLLLGSVGWLENKDRLYLEEDSGGVKKLSNGQHASSQQQWESRFGD